VWGSIRLLPANNSTALTDFAEQGLQNLRRLSWSCPNTGRFEERRHPHKMALAGAESWATGPLRSSEGDGRLRCQFRTIDHQAFQRSLATAGRTSYSPTDGLEAEQWSADFPANSSGKVSAA